MILPIKVTEYADRCNGLLAGTARNSTGTTTTIASAQPASASQPRVSNKAARWCATNRPGRSALFISRLHRAAAQREQTLRAFLDKGDDQHQDQDLGGYRADVRLHELADHAQSERGIYRPGELSDTPEHHHHERIDDIGLAQLRADVADLR